MSAKGLQDSIKFLRRRIKEDYDEFRLDDITSEFNFKFIDDFLKDNEHSDLEKAFFLILHQFPGDSKDYIVCPREMVLVSDVYDMSGPALEYEIDFAIYGGSIDNPVKVAIECDGLRSHGRKHINKDRRKNVNLQAAGWIVMRFDSKEIHEEIEKFKTDENYVCDFLTSIENTITQKLKLITRDTYWHLENKSILTGYKWGIVVCESCNHNIRTVLNHVKVKCPNCGNKFKRDITKDEKIAYNYNGLIIFKD